MKVRRMINRGLAPFRYELVRVPRKKPPTDFEVRLSQIPDSHLYLPQFQPWHNWEKIPEIYHRAKEISLISPDRVWVLLTLAKQALHLEGEFWECGVYRGGSAAMFVELLRQEAAGAPPVLRLFDTFAGMPVTDDKEDIHVENDFNDTSLEAVKKVVGPFGTLHFHPGFIPKTFAGLESSKIAFAHIDVDIYRSILDCCEFILPRLVQGGFMVFDDYGFPSCPGARKAVDEFFSSTDLVPLILPTGQAVVFKGIS